MVKRHFWLHCIEKLWKKRSIIWLSGIRRSGKTTLCQLIPKVSYFDCELPRVRRMLEDPEGFLENLESGPIVLDEIHRLPNPSELLKIAADHYPQVKILATGSSTLWASAKFKDTLTGRKAELWLTPMITPDLEDFKKEDLKYRLLHGGLPPFFMAESIPEKDFQEWIDSYWSKDIQELFHLERRYSFQKFLELLMLQSGGIFEATRFAQACEISRGTISNYLKVLESTFVVHVLKPFSSGSPSEIISAPKVYGFDTGFVCYYRGWAPLRQENLGTLWEHFVLNELQGRLQTRKLFYWRDKRGHEIDFIVSSRKKFPIAIECKWKGQELDFSNFVSFQKRYPDAVFYVVSSDIDRVFEKRVDDIKVKFIGLTDLVHQLERYLSIF